jgi:RNase P/RNase MRP subunit p30
MEVKRDDFVETVPATENKNDHGKIINNDPTEIGIVSSIIILRQSPSKLRGKTLKNNTRWMEIEETSETKLKPTTL